MKEDYRIDKARWEKIPPDQRIGALIKDAWLDVGISQLDGFMFPSALTDGQRAVVSLWFLTSEVWNGGIWQFFHNSSGSYAKAVVTALVRVGAKHHADLFVKAASLFPNVEVPTDVKRRRKLLKSIPTPKWKRVFDDPFWKLEEKPATKLDRFILDYVEKHREEFFRPSPAELPTQPEAYLAKEAARYRIKRSQVGRKKGEKLHWALIESAWDPFWEISRVNKSMGLVFLNSLSPGLRALLIVDIFNKQVLRMGGGYSCLFFLGHFFDALVEGYRLLDAAPYSRLLTELLSHFPPEIRSPDCRAQKVVQQIVRHEQMTQICATFDKQFKKLLENKSNKIEKYIEQYVNQHPEEFFVD